MFPKRDLLDLFTHLQWKKISLEVLHPCTRLRRLEEGFVTQ